MNICEHDTETFYVEKNFHIGTIIYVDENLTIPLTGSTLFSQGSSGKVYSIDPSTGEILERVDGNCDGGIAGTYKVGSDAEDICAALDTTLYTVSSGFMVGDIIYSDVDLLVPLTGYSLIVDGDNIIYDLDDATGEVLSIHGNCTQAYIATYYVCDDLNTICDSDYSYLYRDDNKFLKRGDVVYEDVNLIIPLSGYEYICDVVTGRIFEIDSTTGETGRRIGLSCPQKNN